MPDDPLPEKYMEVGITEEYLTFEQGVIPVPSLPFILFSSRIKLRDTIKYQANPLSFKLIRFEGARLRAQKRLWYVSSYNYTTKAQNFINSWNILCFYDWYYITFYILYIVIIFSY